MEFSAESAIRQQIFSCLPHVSCLDQSRLTVNIRKSIRTNQVIGLYLSNIYMTMYWIWYGIASNHPLPLAGKTTTAKKAFAVHIFFYVCFTWIVNIFSGLYDTDRSACVQYTFESIIMRWHMCCVVYTKENHQTHILCKYRESNQLAHSFCFYLLGFPIRIRIYSKHLNTQHIYWFSVILVVFSVSEPVTASQRR